jgi:formate dehydrogenase iron-sulfur subunit
MAGDSREHATEPVSSLPPEMSLSQSAQSSDAPSSSLEQVWERAVGPFRPVERPAPRQATGFFTDTTICIGCKACEVACKQWNQLPADGFDWSGNSYDNTGELSATSWRHVKFVEQFPAAGQRVALDVVPDATSPARWLMMSDVCKHCVTAPCQQACPTGALIHNEFENAYLQADICNGCSYCIASCPFGVLTRADFDGHAHKCTLCYDRQRDDLVPACAKACPTGSIQFGPIDQLRDHARQRVQDLRQRSGGDAYLYGDAATTSYSALNSFYLLVDRPSVYGLPEHAVNPWLYMNGDYLRSLVGGLSAILVFLLTLLLAGR